MNRGLIAGNEGHGLSSGSIECTAIHISSYVTISGIRNRGIDTTCGQLILRHVTIAANTADTGASGLQVRDAIPVLENSIVAANSGKQCGFLNGFSKNSISVSHSLDGDGSCTAPVFPGPMSGNVVGVDPKLSALDTRWRGLDREALPHWCQSRASASAWKPRDRQWSERVLRQPLRCQWGRRFSHRSVGI